MLKQKVLVSPVIHDNCVIMMSRLAAAGIEVVGADFRQFPFGIRSRYCHSQYLLAGASLADYENDLLALLEQARPDAFLPISTSATLAAIRNLDRIVAVTAINLPDPAAFMAAYNKRTCMAECRSLGIPCPEEYSPNEARALLELTGGEGMVVVKPDYDRGGATGVRYVRQADTLEQEVQTCQERFGGAMIQQYIPGGVENMKTALLLFSSESQLVAAFTTRKIRQWPSTGGSTVVSHSTAEGHLVEQVLPFFKKWRWRGAAEVDLKFDGRDGQHKVIEINPRFPSYLRFVVHCGLDLPMMAAKLVLDRRDVTSARFPAYAVGAKFLNPGLFLRTVFSEVRTNRSRLETLRKAIRDLRGSASVLRGMLADPLPLLGRVLIDARNASGRTTTPSVATSILRGEEFLR